MTPANGCTRLIATNPAGLKEHIPFRVDPSAVILARELSKKAPETWLPTAVSPFPKCVVEWEPIYIKDPTDCVSMVAEITGHSIHLFMFAERGGPIKSVFAIDTSGEKDTMRGRFRNMAWSYTDRDAPEFPSILIPKDYEHASEESIWQAAFECRGQVRIILAILALMNLSRTPLIASREHSGRTIVGGKSVRNYRPHLIVLRPDAPRIVARKMSFAKSVEGIKKRLHDVRSHVRRYRDADGTVLKAVIVRAHTRGDETLGRVEKRYLIERNPNEAV